MPITAIEHVQLAMPPGLEEVAREFYSGLLGLPEVAKPPELAKRGGLGLSKPPLKSIWGLRSTFTPLVRHSLHFS